MSETRRSLPRLSRSQSARTRSVVPEIDSCPDRPAGTPDQTAATRQSSTSGHFRRTCYPRPEHPNGICVTPGANVSSWVKFRPFNGISAICLFPQPEPHSGRLRFHLRNLAFDRHGLLGLANRKGEIDHRLAADRERDAPMDHCLKSGLGGLEFVLADQHFRRAEAPLRIRGRSGRCRFPSFSPPPSHGIAAPEASVTVPTMVAVACAFRRATPATDHKMQAQNAPKCANFLKVIDQPP